jgi:hypothetical protein
MKILSSNDLTILSAYNKICLVILVSLPPSYHPFINPIVNPDDILSVNGIPKLVIANEEAVAAANCPTVLSKRSKRCTELITDLILIVFGQRYRYFIRF